jgi:hypothetical protein
MKFLGYAYRFLSNFIFLALVYYSLNFMERYQQRAVVAILVLVYALMRAATALSFYFFQRIERLELEARRLSGLTGRALRQQPHANTSSMMLGFSAGTAKSNRISICCFSLWSWCYAFQRS